MLDDDEVVDVFELIADEIYEVTDDELDEAAAKLQLMLLLTEVDEVDEPIVLLVVYAGSEGSDEMV